MVFSSLIFIFAFLPLNLIFCYFAPNNRSRNVVMLVFSLIFYAWGEPKYVLLLLLMSLVSWLSAGAVSQTTGAKQKLFLALDVIISLGLLGVFKYSSLVVSGINLAFKTDIAPPNIPLPIGISFYTFQLLTYVVDVYRGQVPAQRNYFTVLLYASLFHQCVAGPIVRYSDVEKELFDRRVTTDDLNYGVQRFCVGLAKKVLLANACGALVDSLFSSDLSKTSALALWAGMIFYTMQIYLDFSAYSDMAIGMGRMTGFHYKENFNYPYASKSATEFWRRWHISLSSFFRDYVYIPMGGNRCSRPRQIFNMFVVWALTGLWHGASLNFICWGLYWFFLLLLEKLFLGKALEKAPAIVSRLYLLFAVLFGWILFKFDDFSQMLFVLRGLFCINGNPLFTVETAKYLSGVIVFAVIAALACTPIAKKIGDSARLRAVNSAGSAAFSGIVRFALPALLFAASAVCLVGETYNPFLYFRF